MFACPICRIISSGTLAARVPKPVPTSTEESCQNEPVLFRSTLNRWIHFRSCRPSWSTPAQDTLIHRSPSYTLFLSSRALRRIYTEWVRRLPCLLSEFPSPDLHTHTSKPECRVFVSLVWTLHRERVKRQLRNSTANPIQSPISNTLKLSSQRVQHSKKSYKITSD